MMNFKLGRLGRVYDSKDAKDGEETDLMMTGDPSLIY